MCCASLKWSREEKKKSLLGIFFPWIKIVRTFIFCLAFVTALTSCSSPETCMVNDWSFWILKIANLFFLLARDFSSKLSHDKTPSVVFICISLFFLKLWAKPHDTRVSLWTGYMSHSIVSFISKWTQKNMNTYILFISKKLWGTHWGASSHCCVNSFLLIHLSNL